MPMEKGSSSSGTTLKKLNSEEIAAMTRMTMEKIVQRYGHHQVSNGTTVRCNGTTVRFYDMNTLGYGWLLPGWVAEERQVKTGRIYRYYYDPEGNFYKSQRMVIETLEKCGMVVLDT